MSCVRLMMSHIAAHQFDKHNFILIEYWKSSLSVGNVMLVVVFFSSYP